MLIRGGAIGNSTSVTWRCRLIQAEFVCGRMRIYSEGDKVVDLGNAGSCDTQCMDAELDILSFSMLKVFDWVLIS